MVPSTYVYIDPAKQLLRQDVRKVPNMIVMLIKWSKTNQFGNRLLEIPLTAIPGSKHCPVTAFKNTASFTRTELMSCVYHARTKGEVVVRKFD